MLIFIVILSVTSGHDGPELAPPAGTCFQISWLERRPMPTPLAGCGGAVINDTLYVVGGRDSSGRVYNYCYAFVPALNRWLTRAPMPTARADLGCVTLGAKIYAIGGSLGSAATDVCEEYDPADDTWTTRAVMPTPRCDMNIAVCGTLIYCIGGMDFSGRVFRNNEVYNSATNSWTTRTRIPIGRIGAATFVLGNRIHVAGGSNLGQALVLHEVYDVATDQWSSRANLIHRRFGVGAGALKGHGYAIGGTDYVQYLSTVEVYDTLTDSWTYETSMEHARQSVAAGLISNRIYVVGGWNDRAVDYNEEGTVPVSIENEPRGRTRSTLTVRPNPSRGQIRVALSAERDRIPGGIITIRDVCGREVRRVNLGDRIQHAIVLELPAGVFYLCFENPDVRVRTKVTVIE